MKSVPKRCKCGHVETNHKFRDKTAKQMLNDAVVSGLIEPIHTEHSMKPLGYKHRDRHLQVFENSVFLPDDMLRVFENLRTFESRCSGMMFSMCNCKIFEMDNLKYLEDCSERSAS